MRNLLAATGAAVAFSLTFAGVSPATAPVTPSMPAAANVTTVTVTMREYTFVLSRKAVPRGKVVFQLRNRGEIAHKFRIKGVTSVRVAPGANRVLRVTFTRAGKYKYVCPISGHAIAGQRGVLTVK